MIEIITSKQIPSVFAFRICSENFFEPVFVLFVQSIRFISKSLTCEVKE